MATDFGTCISVTTELPLRWRYVRGVRVVAEAILRRWSTARGTLAYDPDYGTDAALGIGDSGAERDASELASLLEREAEKDPRVESASVRVARDVAAGTLTIEAQITTAAGPFRLVARAGDAALSLLEVA